MWQDTVIALCQLAFVPSMIPTITGRDKPALATSLSNCLIVTVIAVTQATLGLWYSVATAGSTILLWLILAIQASRSVAPGRASRGSAPEHDRHP